MRVIAGDLKGRYIKTAKGLKTRPTSDKLKEAIFHKIGPFFEGGNCLDLFAGSGSLGIEAISRGVDHTVFIDQSIDAIRTIEQNVTQFNIKNKCEIYRNDAFRALHILSKKNMKFDLILLDPPYDKINYGKLMKALENVDILNDNCIVYIEHRPDENLSIRHGIFTIKDEKKINSTTSITILEKRKMGV